MKSKQTDIRTDTDKWNDRLGDAHKYVHVHTQLEISRLTAE